MVYHLRNKSLKLVRHMIIPLATVIIALAAAMFYSVYPTLPTEPFTLAPVCSLLWVIIGFAVYFYLKRKDPEKMARFGDTIL